MVKGEKQPLQEGNKSEPMEVFKRSAIKKRLRKLHLVLGDYCGISHIS